MVCYIFKISYKVQYGEYSNDDRKEVTERDRRCGVSVVLVATSESPEREESIGSIYCTYRREWSWRSSVYFFFSAA